MRFVRSQLGLTIWVSLWLLVAIFPSLRAQASRVLLSPLPFINTANQEWGLSSEMEQEVARRFPNEAAAQLAPLKGFNYQYSNFSSGEQSHLQDQYFAQYDALEKRFPSDNSVRIQRLRDTLRGQMGIDEGMPPAKSILGKREIPPVWLSKQQLERALQSAQDGAYVDPDNAFFPWMKCVLNFSLKRDTQAILALSEAAQCSHFDDDTMGVAERRIDLMRRLKTTSFENELAETASVLLPHLSPMRTAARAVTGRMRLLRKNGDEPHALELMGLLQRAGAPITHTNGSLVTKLVGEDICVIAWQATIENEQNQNLPQSPLPPLDGPTPHGYFAQKDKVNQAVAARFAEFARAHKRKDLAKEAEALAKSFDGELMSGQIQAPTTDSIWTRYTPFERIRWTEDFLIGLNAFAAVSWVILRIITLGKPVLTSKQKQWAQLSALWSTGAASVLLGIVAVRSPDILTNWNSLPETHPNSALLFVFDNFLPLFVCVLALPIVGALSWNGFKGFSWKFSLKTSEGRKSALIFGAVGLFIILLAGSMLDTPLSVGPQIKFIPPFIQTLLAIIILIGSGLWAWWAQGANKTAKFCFTLAIWLGGVAYFLANASGELPYYSQVIGVSAVFFLSVSAVLGWRGWLPSWRGTWAFIREFSARTGIVAATLALLCTVGYIGLSLCAIPLDNSAKELLQRHLKRGEVAMLRQQISQK